MSRCGCLRQRSQDTILSPGLAAWPESGCRVEKRSACRCNWAGVVEEVGSEVRTFSVGDRLVGLTSPANPTSPMTMMGLGNLSTDIDIPGHTMFGSNAQFVSRPESYFLPLPEYVSMVDAAAAIWAYGTSHRALVDRLQARLGERILIIGALGGMGSATLDLAVGMGLRTIVTTRSAAKGEFLRERGAAEVAILNETDNAAETIRQLGGGDMGLDLAIDFSGDKKMHRLCIDALRPVAAWSSAQARAREKCFQSASATSSGWN